MRSSTQILKEYKESVSPKVGELFRLRKEKNLLFFEKAAEAESEARAQKNNYYLAEVLLEKALMCYHHENDLDSTLSYMEQARELVGEDPVAYKTMSEYYRISGVINFFKGNVFKASELYDAGIRLLESLEKTDYHDLEILGSIYFNSTNLYRNIPRNHVRLSKMYKAYELFKKINYELGIARCLNSIAIYDDRYTEKIESEPLFLEAIEIFKHNNDERGCAVVKSNMGSMYCKNNRFNEGIKHLLEAYEMLKKIGHSSFIATCARQIATAYREHNEPRTALKYLQEAEAAVEKINSTHDLIEIYHEFSWCYEALNDTVNALHYLKKHYTFYHDLVEFDKQTLQSEERINFELREQQKEADILLQKNKEINEYARQLEATNADLQRFTHIASHDLKEPLRMVSLYLQLLNKTSGDGLSDTGREYLQFANEGAQRMYNIINSLVLLNHISADTPREFVSLNDVFVDAKRNLQYVLLTRQAAITADELPGLFGNKGHLIQLFQNLIANAIKYNTEDRPTLHIAYKRIGAMHQLRFRDNGIGIPREYREKVFEIFQRLNNRKEYEGTGIGLTICRKIVESMQGRIFINPDIENGTEFIVELPAAK